MLRCIAADVVDGVDDEATVDSHRNCWAVAPNRLAHNCAVDMVLAPMRHVQNLDDDAGAGAGDVDGADADGMWVD